MESSGKITRDDILKMSIEGIIKSTEIRWSPLANSKNRMESLRAQGATIAELANHLTDGIVKTLNIREE